MLKVVVVGYGKMLAALVKGAIAKGHDVVGVLRCDRVNYSKFALFFKDIFLPSYDYSFLKSLNIYDIKANSVNSKEFLDEIKKLNADIILVGSWSEKFKPDILNFPKYGVINCHPSLLPKHRGPNPYFWAIYCNDTQTGVTFHIMDENFDTGDILAQAAFKIEPHMTGGILRDKAVVVAQLMIGELLCDIEKNKIVPVVQNEGGNYDKYPYENIDVIDFSDDAVNIYNRVRALHPWAYCRCRINNKVYKIKKCAILNIDTKTDEYPQGTVICARQNNKILHVKCARGAVELYVF